MSERHDRCRFWPNCYVHLGETPPRHFSKENRMEMIELRRDGWAFQEKIAVAFGAHPGAVATIVGPRDPFG